MVWAIVRPIFPAHDGAGGYPIQIHCTGCQRLAVNVVDIAIVQDLLYYVQLLPPAGCPGIAFHQGPGCSIQVVVMPLSRALIVLTALQRSTAIHCGSCWSGCSHRTVAVDWPWRRGRGCGLGIQKVEKPRLKEGRLEEHAQDRPLPTRGSRRTGCLCCRRSRFSLEAQMRLCYLGRLWLLGRLLGPEKVRHKTVLHSVAGPRLLCRRWRRRRRPGRRGNLLGEEIPLSRLARRKRAGVPEDGALGSVLPGELPEGVALVLQGRGGRQSGTCEARALRKLHSRQGHRTHTRLQGTAQGSAVVAVEDASRQGDAAPDPGARGTDPASWQATPGRRPRAGRGAARQSVGQRHDDGAAVAGSTASASRTAPRRHRLAALICWPRGCSRELSMGGRKPSTPRRRPREHDLVARAATGVAAGSRAQRASPGVVALAGGASARADGGRRAPGPASTPRAHRFARRAASGGPRAVAARTADADADADDGESSAPASAGGERSGRCCGTGARGGERP
eukprot:scaffold1554_cov401-Prasinococcus_capsulatus_cf.AAC.36